MIRDGAVYVENDLIKDVGEYEKLHKAHRTDVVLGSADSIIMPGLTNAHHHGKGISTLQRGVEDEPLEVRLLSYYEHKCDVDTYDDTLLAAANLIQSGVTSVIHHHYGVAPSNSSEYICDLQKAAEAWVDSGLRVVLAPFLEDRGWAGMVEDLGGGSTIPHGTPKNRSLVDTNAYFEAVSRLRANFQRNRMVSVFLGPTGPQWCTDELLERVKATAKKLRTGIHMHLLETKYQQIHGFKKYGQSQVEHLEEIGFLGPELSCAHSVWLTRKDIKILARNSCTVVHNPSSNLRLFSGIAPVFELKRQGVNVALGTDALGINDDDDFFQEIRLCGLLHRQPGIDGRKLSSNQLLDMATVAGSKAMMSGDKVGQLKRGWKADLIVLQSDRIRSSCTNSEMPITDLIVDRAKAIDVTTVMVNGRVLMKDKRLTTLDKKSILRRINEHMRKRRKKSDAAHLKNQLRSFFKGIEDSYSLEP